MSMIISLAASVQLLIAAGVIGLNLDDSKPVMVCRDISLVLSAGLDVPHLRH